MDQGQFHRLAGDRPHAEPLAVAVGVVRRQIKPGGGIVEGRKLRAGAFRVQRLALLVARARGLDDRAIRMRQRQQQAVILRVLAERRRRRKTGKLEPRDGHLRRVARADAQVHKSICIRRRQHLHRERQRGVLLELQFQPAGARLRDADAAELLRAGPADVVSGRLGQCHTEQRFRRAVGHEVLSRGAVHNMRQGPRALVESDERARRGQADIGRGLKYAIVYHQFRGIQRGVRRVAGLHLQGGELRGAERLEGDVIEQHARRGGRPGRSPDAERKLAVRQTIGFARHLPARFRSAFSPDLAQQAVLAAGQLDAQPCGEIFQARPGEGLTRRALAIITEQVGAVAAEHQRTKAAAAVPAVEIDDRRLACERHHPAPRRRDEIRRRLAASQRQQRVMWLRRVDFEDVIRSVARLGHNAAGAARPAPARRIRFKIPRPRHRCRENVTAGPRKDRGKDQPLFPVHCGPQAFHRRHAHRPREVLYRFGGIYKISGHRGRFARYPERSNGQPAASISALPKRRAKTHRAKSVHLDFPAWSAIIRQCNLAVVDEQRTHT